MYNLLFSDDFVKISLLMTSDKIFEQNKTIIFLQVEEIQLDYTYCRPNKNEPTTCAEILEKDPRAPCVCMEDFIVERDIKVSTDQSLTFTFCRVH